MAVSPPIHFKEPNALYDSEK